MTKKKKAEKKKDEEIQPLDLTTDEAANFLFPKKAIDHMKHVAHEADEKKSVSAKSSRKHSTK